MEYHLTKHTLRQPGTVLDNVTEQAVDADVTLPDYCPDIEKILSCTLIPKVYVTNLSGDRLNVEGSSCVRVMYLDAEKNGMRSYEHSVPFSANIPLRESPADCAVYVDAKPEYINCRALSPRKLSLHGAFSLCTMIIVPSEQEYCGYEDGGDLQVRRENVAVSRLSGLCSESFSVQEDIPADGSSGISALLSHRVTARITELKAMHHKIMLSAELKIDTMYLSGVEHPEAACMSYSLPVSRVIDCDGADEDTVIDGELSVLSSDLRLSDDALDGSAVLSADIKLCFNALCYADDEIEILSDAFSTEQDAQVRTAPFSCRTKTLCRSDTDVSKVKVAVDEDIGKVKDVHCEKISASCAVNDGKPTIQVKLCVGILYENTEDETRYVERDAELLYHPDIEGCDDIERLKVSVDSLSYRLTDSTHLELRAELCYRMTLSCRKSCPAVTAVSAEDDAPVRKPDSALILYYADSGESIWEIGKHFCSRPEDIIAENEIEGDCIDSDRMLLIPTA